MRTGKDLRTARSRVKTSTGFSMRVPKVLGLAAAVTFAFLGLLSAMSASGMVASGARSQSAISPDERAARDQMARQELLSLQGASQFTVRLPSILPAGFTYDRVMWDSSNPEHGFAVWFLGPDGSAGYGLQLIEAPFVRGAPKDTLNLPGLTPMSLQSGNWQMLQKADDPGKGLWILVTIQNGLHIEVDGEKDPALLIANQV